jgi:hypothetical protein
VEVCKTLHAFEFNDQHVFDEDVCEIFSDILAFVAYIERSLSNSADTTKFEFDKQRALLDAFKKARTQRVGDLKDSPEHTLSKRI